MSKSVKRSVKKCKKSNQLQNFPTNRQNPHHTATFNYHHPNKIFDILKFILHNFYPTFFNLIYSKNKIYFMKIFSYYIMVDEKKGFEMFVESLEDIYKFAYFS